MSVLSFPSARLAAVSFYEAAFWVSNLVIVSAIALCLAPGAHAAQVKVQAELSQSVLSAEGGTVYLRVGLKAFDVRRRDERPPVNVALVLDRSGSMRGRRLAAAKEAARQAVSRLSGDDTVALIAYNDDIEILQRATRLDSKRDLRRKIDRLQASGMTALYAGVEQGGREVRRYLSERQINRVILMSDGLANVGPKTPRELAELGQELASDGISVTTIGLGLNYNEDLMSRLALASDGNHAFAETPDDLVEIFDSEFGDTLSIAAQDIEIIIECRDGFRPKRILGRRAKIDGNQIRIKLNQLTGGAERYLVVEAEAEGGRALGAADVADVKVRYLDLEDGKRSDVEARVSGRFSKDKRAAENSINKSVMSDVTAQVATEQNEKAVSLRDAGDVAGAKKLLEKNAAYIKKAKERLGSGEGAAPAASIGILSELEDDNRVQAEKLTSRDWAKTRKSMRYKQHKAKRQQTY